MIDRGAERHSSNTLLPFAPIVYPTYDYESNQHPTLYL